MKKITFLSAVLLTIITNAQITYTSGNFATAGQEFTVSKASSFIGMNFAATGANYNWNYSTLNADSQSTAGWQNPNGAGYKLSWCLSHLYIFNCNSQFNNNFTHSSLMSDGIELANYGVSNIVEHSRLNASNFANRMRGMTATVSGISLPMTVEYDDPDEMYQFPMNYNDNYTTTGHMSMDLNNLGLPFVYTLSTQRTNTVQGWGSLTTPMGTFPNVLKLKTKLVKTETYSYNDISIPITTTTISYQWFSQEYGIPVLQADGIELFNLFIPTAVTYLDQQLCLTADANFAYLPIGNYDPDSQSATVPFINTSTNYSSVSWDFGDGGSSTDATPSHNYGCPGTYQVTLTVNNNACTPNSTDTFTLPVVVTDTQNALTLGVTNSGTALMADRNLPGTTYQWIDCANGNAAIAGETSQTFTPSADGNYACIINTNGCEGTSACTAFTMCIAANAEFTAPASVDFDGASQSAVVSFNNLSTNYTAISWDFGDGSNATDGAPSHSYTCPGTYTVTMTATNACASTTSDTFTSSVVVTDTQNAMTLNVTNTGASLTANRNLPGTTYQWVDCDNGNAVITGQTSQSFTPTTNGHYACIIDTNGCGGTSECAEFTLCPAAIAQFTAPSTVDFNASTSSAIVLFSNSSTNYSSIFWDFGDGITSTEEASLHSYTCPGTYSVSMTVTNNACATPSSDTFTSSIVVTDTQNAMTLGVTNMGTSLMADRNLPGTTYQWIDCDNGNAGISGETNQSFTPSASGNYACAINTNGCNGTSACVSFTLLQTSQFDNGQFKLYPNPTTGELRLSGNLAIKDVVIYNALGMLVGKELNLSGKATGIYFVKITSDQGTFIRKVVKQ